MLREITAATRLVIVCNPNNPTSTALPLANIADFIAEVPRHVCVIVDEAYCEFNLLEDPDASIELLDAHPNLVLLRTFSKVYGLCGLRVGFALCGSEDLPRAVDQVRQPFFCNAVAQAARGRGARPPGRRHRPRHAHDRRAHLGRRAPARAGDRAGRVAGQLLLVRARRARPESGASGGEVMRGLAERGVLVRGGGALGKPGALRVTYGTPEENAIFLDALAEISERVLANA